MLWSSYPLIVTVATSIIESKSLLFCESGLLQMSKICANIHSLGGAFMVEVVENAIK